MTGSSRPLLRTSCVASLAGLVLLASTARAQWTIQRPDTTIEYRGLSAVSEKVVWASGTRGRVARTIDVGAMWTIHTIRGAESLDLRALHARNANVAWALSAGPAERGQAKIYKTIDGGRQWTLQYSTADSGVFLDALAFWDDTHGIAMSDPVGGTFFLLTTDDGGATWTRVSADALPPVLPGEAAFAASGTCLVVEGIANAWMGTGGGARARVFRSTDRGRTWNVADTPIHAGVASTGIFSVAFADAEHGVVVGGDYSKPKELFDNVAITSDGGRSWRLATVARTGYMSSVAFVPGTRGRALVAVGLAGTARSTDGGERWTMVDDTPYNSVAFVSADVGWAVGPRGRIGKWGGRGALAPPARNE